MKSITRDLSTVLLQRSRPGITVWNRLEGRPRADQFERALRAEVRDPLWMLTRQWQMGEFIGDDAGSPIFGAVRVETTRLRYYKPAGGEVQPFDDSIPLEAKVERLPIPFAQGAEAIAFDLRLMMGRHWLKLIAPLPAATRAQYLAAYPIDPPDPLVKEDASICAHPEAWSVISAVAGQCLDGAKLYFYLKQPPHRASDGIAALVGLEAQADLLGERFVAWFERLIYAPEPASEEVSAADGSAWLPERLEYQFDCAAPIGGAGSEQKVYAAEQYFHGHLDWYNFDSDPSRKSLLAEAQEGAVPPEASSSKTLTMLPTQVTFNGMPNTRWWAFEDGRTNFGDIKPDTTDLAKLMLIEFGLVYANDWYLVPFTVPAGSIAKVRGVAVTNVFGERIWIEAAGRGDDDDWQRWAMFLVSIKGKGHEPADLSLLVPPSAQKVLEGRPREAVMLARDEMANMVWGVEKTIALATGEPKDGQQAAHETRAFFERDLERRLGAPPEAPPFAEGAKIRYELMSSVPENWIPLIPVHVDGSNREVQLQRAAMLRILEGDTAASPDPVRPRTSLLRPGLEHTPALGYYLHEEEVPRAGVFVTQSFQRTRWRDGRAWLWLGARKRTGRGEGSSGLAFDRIVEKR